MSEEAYDEMSVIASIYSEKGEFELLQDSEQGLTYRINTVVEGGNVKTGLSLTFHFSPEYPRIPPDICISSEDLSRKQCQDIKHSVLDRVSALTCEPMVHDLVLWLQQNLSDLTSCGSGSAQAEPEESGEGTWTALLLLDHMRAKTKYIKWIEKCTLDLGLTGRLLTGKLILILLQGSRRSIKEYLHLQKTEKVDIDSSGKRCKEKMMSVLCEKPLSGDTEQISSFEVKNVGCFEDLKKEFDLVGLLELYEEYVSSLL